MTQGEETSATGTGGKSSPAPAAHSQIGRYKILRELGRGAMGVVYEAVDPKIGRKVALKVLHDVQGISSHELEEFRSRFFREARTAGMLSHRNIVVIHDVDHDEALGITYMAMELLKGQSVRDLLRSGVKFTTDQAIDVCIQVAEGLDHAHRQGIVHRDVKPDNLMLLEDGTLKITDFGIAKISTSNLTRTGQFIGTPNYMSPEQVIGHVIDGRSDLFSLGIILYELLTGEKPFMGSSLTTITYQIVNVDPIEPSKIRPGIPKIFDQIAAKLLRKAPDERFQTGKEVAEGLRAIRDGGASAAAAAAAAASATQVGGQTNTTRVSGDATHVSTPTMGGGGTQAGTSTIVSQSGVGAAPAKSGIGRIAIGALAGMIVLGAAGALVYKMRSPPVPQGASGATGALPQPAGPSAPVVATTPTPAATSAPIAAPVGPTAVATAAEGPTAAAVTPPRPTGPAATPGPSGETSRATTPRPRPAGPAGPPLILPPRAGTLPAATTTEPPKPVAQLAQVNLIFTHKLKSGNLQVLIDGKQVLSLDVASAKKRGKDQVTDQFTVPDGRHEVRLCLSSPDIDDSPKCSYRSFAFVMNRTSTIRAEHTKMVMAKNMFAFTIE